MTLVLWVLIGGCLSALHLGLLWAALNRALPKQPEQARTVVLRGLPLRLLAVTPLLLLAAQEGLIACLGLVAGSLAARWGVCYLYNRRA